MKKNSIIVILVVSVMILSGLSLSFTGNNNSGAFNTKSSNSDNIYSTLSNNEKNGQMMFSEATENVQISTIVNDNGVYILGGMNTSSSPLLIIYNSTTGSFLNLSSKVPSVIECIDSILISGKTLYISGVPSGQAFPLVSYNLSTGLFTDLSSEMSSAPPSANVYQAALSGQILYLGGYYQSNTQYPLLMSYNVSSGSVQNLTSTIPFQSNLVNVVLYDRGSLFVSGSKLAGSLFGYIYNVSSHSTVTANIPPDVYGVTGGTVYDNNFFIGGASVQGGALFEISTSGVVTNLSKYFANSPQITDLSPSWNSLFVGGWGVNSPIVSLLNVTSGVIDNISLSGAWASKGGETFGSAINGNEMLIGGGISTQYGNYSGSLLGILYRNGTFVDISSSLYKNPAMYTYNGVLPSQKFYVYSNTTIAYPGSQITFYGQFLNADSVYTISYGNISFTVTTNSSGTFAYSTKLSESISPGDYQITLTNGTISFYNYFAVPYEYSEMIYGAHYPVPSKYVSYSNLRYGAVVRVGNYLEFYRVANGTFPLTSINYLVQWNQILFQNLTSQGWTVAPVNQLGYASQFSINPLTFHYGTWDDYGISKVSQNGVFYNFQTQGSSIYVNGSTMIVWIPYQDVNESWFPWAFATDYVQDAPVYNPDYRIEAGQNFVSYFYANETPSIYTGDHGQVDFKESGLPSGAPWTVQIINNSSPASSFYNNYSAYESSLTVLLPPGSYKYVAFSNFDSGLYTTPNATGKFSLASNKNLSFSLSFSISPVSINGVSLTEIPEGKTVQFNTSSTEGPSAISFAVMNSTMNVRIVEGTETILNKTIVGNPLDLEAVAISNDYGYVNYNANGEPVSIFVSNNGSVPGYFTAKLWNYYISNYTASLETISSQFSENFNPTGNLPYIWNNTGLSFTFVAPYYSQPIALAFWIGEGYNNPTTGKEWWAQVGFNNWLGGMNDVSYAGWGIFSNIFGNPGGTDGAFPLIPNETYNISMQVISNDTWGFLVNGRPIVEPGLTGYLNTTSSYANGGITMGFEVLPVARAGSPNSTTLLSSPIRVIKAMQVRVDGQWETIPNFAFNNVGGNSNGMDLWAVQGNIQNKSIPPGQMVFGSNGSPLFNIPAEEGNTNYPIYGNFTYSFGNFSAGGTYINVITERNGTLYVEPVSGPVLVSLLQLDKNSNLLSNFTNYVLYKPTFIENPYAGTREDIRAASLYNSVFGYDGNYQEIVISNVTTSYGNWPVTFNEIDLPSGSTWYVNLSNGQSFSSSTSTLRFSEPNGTYSYIVATSNRIYSPSPSSGSFTVSGASVSEAITFSKVTYIVTFSESGLPSGSTWYVNLSNGQSFSSSTSTLRFSEPNGTYSYIIATSTGLYEPVQPSGSFTVNGATVSESVTLSKITLYDVTFTESGLPPGTLWYINDSDAYKYTGIYYFETNSNTITVQLPNGTFTFFAMSAMDSDSYNPIVLNFTVDGEPLSEQVTFATVAYKVTFTETGLPSGSIWYVNLSNGADSGSIMAPSYSVNLTNGSYSYSVATSDKTYSPSYKDSFTVNGEPLSEQVTFATVAYKVTFTESGLPSGSIWYVSLTNGQSFSSSSSTITFSEPNGTYSYTLSTSDGLYSPSPSSGIFTVNGSPLSESITFIHLSTVVLKVSPSSSIVTINGIKSSGTVYLEPGSYFINASLSGYGAFSNVRRIQPVPCTRNILSIRNSIRIQFRIL